MERKVGVVVVLAIICIIVSTSLIVYFIVIKDQNKGIRSAAILSPAIYSINTDLNIISIKLNTSKLDEGISVIKFLLEDKDNNNYIEYIEVNKEFIIQDIIINYSDSNIKIPSKLLISSLIDGVEKIILQKELIDEERLKRLEEEICNNNGKVNKGEECDDGNLYNNDSCLNDCSNARCGDGYIYIEGGEECDGENFGIYGNGIDKCREYSTMFGSKNLICDNCMINTSKCDRIIFALGFDGNNDGVDISELTLYENEKYTLTVWIKSNETGSTARSIIECADSLDSLLSLEIIRKECFFNIVTDAKNTSKKERVTSPGIKPHEWIHIAVSYDHSDINIYVNGALMQSKVQERKIDGDIGCKIGYADDLNSQNFYGSINDVRIYNKALTHYEVSQIYKDKLSVDPVTDKLVGWWKFDEGSGIDVKDFSLNNHTGLFIGNPQWVREESK